MMAVSKSGGDAARECMTPSLCLGIQSLSRCYCLGCHWVLLLNLHPFRLIDFAGTLNSHISEFGILLSSIKYKACLQRSFISTMQDRTWHTSFNIFSLPFRLNGCLGPPVLLISCRPNKCDRWLANDWPCKHHPLLRYINFGILWKQHVYDISQENSQSVFISMSRHVFAVIATMDASQNTDLLMFHKSNGAVISITSPFFFLFNILLKNLGFDISCFSWSCILNVRQLSKNTHAFMMSLHSIHRYLDKVVQK